MATDYIVRLKCPYGDREQLLMLEGREESLKQILETPWDFECPLHGVQREIPLEGTPKSQWSRSKSKRKGAKAADRAMPQPRSSKRISLHVPVMIHGLAKDKGSFQEETTTSLVNASGGLLPLTTDVALGDKLLIRNKQTKKEHECRVAYVGRDVYGKLRVGVAFNHPDPDFWKVNRREPRVTKRIRVSVRGKDRSGHAFVRNVCAVEVSRHGARLEDVGYLIQPGETIHLKRYWQTARFRVTWIGQAGTPQDGQVGVLALEPDKNIWGIPLP
jgi:hypothetical protein